MVMRRKSGTDDCTSPTAQPRTHKLRHDRWLARHQNVDFHLTPIHASWLKRVEVCFRLLVHTLRRASFTAAEQQRDAIHAFLAVVS